jgi:hypothetical protein
MPRTLHDAQSLPSLASLVASGYGQGFARSRQLSWTAASPESLHHPRRPARREPIAEHRGRDQAPSWLSPGLSSDRWPGAERVQYARTAGGVDGEAARQPPSQ